MDQTLLNTITYITKQCYDLVEHVFHTSFETSGNIGVFAQSDEEFKRFSSIAQSITKQSNNPNQKYFELIDALTVELEDVSLTHTNLYIRKYDPSEYGKYLGDIDFVTDNVNYLQLKEQVLNNQIEGATMYDRPGWDTIQITQDDYDVVSYLSTIEMAKKVRVKFDNVTNL